MKRNRWRPWLEVVVGRESLISSAGGVLLAQTARVCGLDKALTRQLRGWRRGRAVHDPGKVVCDLAITIALGGDCPADLAVLRAQPGVFGPVASDPTVSRVITALADSGAPALDAIRAAHAQARAQAWDHAGVPWQDQQIVIDLDATVLTAHSGKQDAAKTWKKTFGHHPMLAHIDHGRGGTGEQVAALLRPGDAGSNTAKDHITALDLGLAQIPAHLRAPDTDGRARVLVRADTGGASLAFTHHIHNQGMEFTIGANLHTVDTTTVLATLTEPDWQPAIEPGGRTRDGAWITEATSLADLSTWPPGTRLILRKERPHPGAQLRITDTDGLRVTGFLTTSTGEITTLELRHRQRARQEDRIRNAKDTGLRNLPYHHSARNQIWMLICALAGDLITWTQRLALTGEHRVAEPKRLRLRLFNVAARLIRTARRTRLKIPPDWPWTTAIITAHQRLTALATP